jgi:hypothetical protein
MASKDKESYFLGSAASRKDKQPPPNAAPQHAPVNLTEQT